MYKVIKRDGEIVDFDISKITRAIKKAFDATNTPYRDFTLELLSVKICNDYEKKIKDNKISVEDIQDTVEKVIINAGYADAAKAYILYRKSRENIRNAKSTMINYKKTVDNYLGVADWRVKENSTVSYSLGGLILSNSGAMTANYWLNEIYDKEIGEAHRQGDIHVHDLSMLSGYCFTGDTKILTPDGKNPTFKELVMDGIKELNVYSYDNDTLIENSIAINPRVTTIVTKLMEVLLDDNTKIKCTIDHLFLLSSGAYKEARNLEIGDELMSVNISKNIKVKNVTLIKLDHDEIVYDLTVPKYENFAILAANNTGVIVHNCAGWNLLQLIKEGLGGVTGKIASAPASHLSTLCNQMVNFLGILQNEWSGKISCVPDIKIG